MSYKIVETVERGQKVLSIIPENWEKNGILKWPPRNQDYEILKMDPNSKPRKAWLSMPCRTKRAKLLTFDTAAREIKDMSDVTDTEIEEEKFDLPPSTPPVQSKQRLNFDFVDLVRNTFTHQEKYVPDATTQENACDVQKTPAAINVEESQFTGMLQETPAAKNVEEPQFTGMLRETTAANNVEESQFTGMLQETPAAKNVEEPQFTGMLRETTAANNVEESQFTGMLQETTAANNFEESQFTGMLQGTPVTINNSATLISARETPAEDTNLHNLYLVTETSEIDLQTTSQVNIEILSQKIDNLTKVAYDLQNNQQNIMLKLATVATSLEEYIKKSTNKETTKATCSNFKAIGDVKMLQEFENSLESPDLKREFMRQLSIVCSKGKGRGINNAYVLVDVMFTRKLMTECSWAGGTRKESPKICFKSYTRTINLFFDIIHDTDKDFTKAECDTFFKNVLRHSVARNSSQNLRCSAAKRRPKKNVSAKYEKMPFQEIRTTNASSSNTTTPAPVPALAERVDKENVDPVDLNPRA